MSHRPRTVAGVDTVELLDAVRSELDRWGWVQLTDETENGLDLVTAFEAVTRMPLKGTTPEEDRIIDTFAEPALDDALRIVAGIVGGDPDDGQLPGQRWAWVHALTVFNDAPTTTERDVRLVLTIAGDVARARRAADEHRVPARPGRRTR
jgi:hypothetical protein